jgi:hypothetical protein
VDPLPQGPQTVTGVLKRADISIKRRGTHVLLRGEEPVYYVESSTITLRPLEGKQVELQGTLEYNTDPKELPVLVVTKVLGGIAEERRAWTVPSLGITFDVPRSWKGSVAKSVAQFTVSGSALPLLRVLSEDASALPFNFQTLTSSGTDLALTPLVIGTRKAVSVLNETQGSLAVYVDPDPVTADDKKLLAFVFHLEPDENGETGDQEEAYIGMVRTLRFKAQTLPSSPAQSTGTGASADGKPCGGPAGVLCPAGYSCRVTDTATDIGGCQRI